MLNKLRIGSIFFLLFSVSCFGQSETDYSAAIKNIRDAVVQVHAQSNKRVSGGTGFIVAGNYVVTNCHVLGLCGVRPPFSNPQVTVAFRIPDFNVGSSHMTDSFRDIAAEIVGLDIQNDLALLRLPKGFEFTLENTVYIAGGRGAQPRVIGPKVGEAHLSAEVPADGTVVLISGYPLMEPSLVSQRGMIASHTHRADIETIPLDQNSDLLFVDAIINHGNSGGPVYLPSSSEVIGVAEGFITAPTEVELKQPMQQPLLFSIGSNSGISFIIPAKYVIALLNKYNIPIDAKP